MFLNVDAGFNYVRHRSTQYFKAQKNVNGETFNAIIL